MIASEWNTKFFSKSYSSRYCGNEEAVDIHEGQISQTVMLQNQSFALAFVFLSTKDESVDMLKAISHTSHPSPVSSSSPQSHLFSSPIPNLTSQEG